MRFSPVWRPRNGKDNLDDPSEWPVDDRERLMAEDVRSQNQTARPEDRVVAYLSHSYRPQDRAVNMTVWRPLNDAGVIFTVDPPSKEKRPMDVTFLERMMQRSHCFVAIVPTRPREKGGSFSTWSPYQEFECRLAIRANKPRLIVVEHGIDMGPLPDDEPHCWFERSPFSLNPEFDDDVAKFVQHARSSGRTRQDRSGYLPKTGVLRWTPSDDRWERLAARGYGGGHRTSRSWRSTSVPKIMRCSIRHEI